MTHPTPCRTFSSTTVQMLSLCSLLTKSALSRMMSGIVCARVQAKWLPVQWLHALQKKLKAWGPHHDTKQRHAADDGGKVHHHQQAPLPGWRDWRQQRRVLCEALGRAHKAVAYKRQDERSHRYLRAAAPCQAAKAATGRASST